MHEPRVGEGCLGLDQCLVRYGDVAVEHYHEQNKAQVASLGQKVHEEVRMIVKPDAVVDPRTVVIESLNTAVADVAVPRVRSEYDLTCWAEFAWLSRVAVEFLDQLTEGYLRAALHVSWLRGCCQRKEHLQRNE